MEIRTLKETDAPLLFTLIDENRARLKQWLPTLDRVRSEEDALNVIKNAQIGMESQTEVTLAIWEGDDLAGTVALNNWDTLHRSASIGYWLGEKYLGKGIARQACKGLLQYSFENLDINRIELSCSVDNSRSEALAKDLGFSFEGISRESELLDGVFVDQKVYALLKRDFLAQNRGSD